MALSRALVGAIIIIIVATIEETIEGMSNPLPAPVKECQRIDNFIAPKYG